jgi:hypothetical protein
MAAAAVVTKKLYELYIEQCAVKDASRQIQVEDGELIKKELILRSCALTNGINLAKINYEKLRQNVLAEFPQIKSISFVRMMPDKLRVTIEERTAICRLGVSGNRNNTGLVTDREGYVFRKYRDTSSLPIIRNSSVANFLPGKLLPNRAIAAIELLETLKNPEFSELAALDADISKKDYIVITFKSDYSRAKIAWDDMDENTPAGKTSLSRQLTHLMQAMRLKTGTRLWNATDTSVPGKIYAETKGVTE